MNTEDAWTDQDRVLMSRALQLANEAAEAGEAPIGALVVDPQTGDIIGEGRNQPISTNDPSGHAEIVALRAAAARLGNYRLTNCSMFVTLEPCTMCAGAISQARIGRLVFGAIDEKGGAVVSGVRYFESATCHWSPSVEAGLGGEESADMLRQFFRARRS